MFGLGTKQGMKAAIIVGFLALLLVQSVYATSYSVNVKTDSGSYTGAQAVKVTGSVTPAPGTGTAALVRVLNPAGSAVVVGDAPVNGTSGAYEFDFVTGGTSAWTAGTYTVNVTWGAYPPTIHNATSFAYVPTTTTTSSTTTSSSTVTTTSTTSTTSSSSTTTTSSSTSSSATSSSSSTSGGGGGEFPLLPVALAVVVVVVVVGLFFFMRMRGRRGP